MTPHAICPVCGEIIPADSLEGNCPACLMRLATDTASTKIVIGSDAERSDVSRSTSGAPGPPRSVSDYEFIEEIARGGMGVILRVQDRKLSRTLAMKVMSSSTPSRPMSEGARSAGEGAVGSDPTSRLHLARFLEEAQVTAQLDHPGIVPVHEVGADAQGRPFFTMKLVKGRDLNEIFKLAREEREGWNLPRAVGVLVKACQALAYAHSKGVIHRDLKPANIMVGRFGEVYVMDWGLAKITGKKDLHDIRPKDVQFTSASLHSPRQEAAESTPDSPLITMDGSVVGTPAYMPPEQARGQVEEVDQASDIYSIGAILYSLLTGQPPFVEPGARISPHTILARVLDSPPKRVHRLNPQAPPELIAICEKAMAREKPDRYGSSADLAEDLQAFLDHRVVRAYRTGAVAEFKSWVKRNKGLALASLGTALLAVVFLTTFAMKERRHALALKENLARQYLNSGNSLCQEGDVARGLHWLARSLAETPDQSAGLKDAIREHVAYWTHAWHSPGHVLTSEHGLVAAALSPDGKLAGTGDSAGIVKFWFVENSEPLPVTLQHDGVGNLAFSPDGQRVVTVGRGVARIWLTGTGRRVGVDIPHPDLVRAVFSPDGMRLLTHGDDFEETTVRLWNTETGKMIGPPLIHTNRLWHAVFSPDGTRILTACGDWIARLWSVQTGLQIGAEMRHSNEIVKVEFSPDGKLTATASQDRTAQLWDAWTGKPVGPRMRHAREVWSVAFSPDGRWVLTGSYDRTARLWNGTNGEPTDIVLEHKEALSQVGFSEDGTWIYTVSNDRKIRLWSTKDWQLLGEPMHHEDGIETVRVESVNLRGRTLLAHSGSRVLLWSIDDAKRRVVSLFAKAPYGDLTPENLTFSADGKRLLMSDHVGWTWWWSPDSGQAMQAPFRHGERLRTVAASPDGKHFLTGSKDHEARLWTEESGERPVANFAHSGEVGVVAFSPNGRFVATAGENTAVLWSTETGRQIGKPLQHPAGVGGLAFSPDGTLLATGCDDRVARLWSVANGTEIVRLAGHQSNVGPIAFGHDGKLLATGSSDKTVRLWNVATGGATGVILQHEAGVADVCFSPDGRLLATAARIPDDHLRFWAPETGELLYPPLRVCCGLNDLDFSPDGSRIAASGANVFPTVWSIPPPFRGDARQAELLVQVLTWQEMDAKGVLTWLGRATWRARKAELEKLGGRQ